MPGTDSFVDLMTRLRAGDETAAADIFHRFARRLIGLARSRLDALMRQKVDPEDVMQSAFRCFFARQAERPYPLEDWNSLWSLLARFTVRKCGHRIEHFHAQCRDLTRETAPPAAAESGSELQVLAREPTPSEVLMLTETVESLLRDLDQREREIVTLALQGYTAAEISAQVNRPERTVYRLLARIKKRLQRQQAGDEEVA